MGLIDRFKRLFSKKESGLDYDPSEYTNQVSYKDQQTPYENSASSKLDKALDTSRDFVEATAKEVKEQGAALWNELKDKVEHVEEATRDTREKIISKAKEGLEKVEQMIDETLEKAQQEEKEDLNKDKDKDGIADTPIDFGNSLEKKHSSFFDKAEKWVQQNENNQANTGLDKDGNSDKVLKPLELPKEPGE